jgi:hypothetical protein
MSNAKGYATSKLGIAWPGGLHELPSWAGLLIEERKVRGVSYPKGFDRALNSRVKIIYLNWREHLRYRVNRPYPGEVSHTLGCVFWLLGQ